MTDRFAGLSYDIERKKGRRLATVWLIDQGAGADVTLAPLFDELLSTERLDALNDVIGLLIREYNDLLEKEDALTMKNLGHWPIVLRDD